MIEQPKSRQFMKGRTFQQKLSTTNVSKHSNIASQTIQESDEFTRIKRTQTNKSNVGQKNGFKSQKSNVRKGKSKSSELDVQDSSINFSGNHMSISHSPGEQSSSNEEYEHSNSESSITDHEAASLRKQTPSKPPRKDGTNSMTTGKKQKRDLFGEIDTMKEMITSLVSAMGQMQRKMDKMDKHASTKVSKTSRRR